MKKKNELEFFAPDTNFPLEIPHADTGVSAGFPSPAMDFMETRLDINKLLIKNPLSTFYVKVNGNSMVNAGIKNGDLLIVDRSLSPENSSIAVCFIDGEFTVKRLLVEKDGLMLMPENEHYLPIKITEGNTFFVWGIVTHVISKL
ncbi:translesion error-prone DNA polymerase V autoproteolytic subunit [Flavobacterium sp. MAH-1]|uniref:Translesion error-prone DNA polymerase V autoproteolytic subunit n=1 Tax=Flavobacterium agri TaxID=2743471 RepID=A0A7Y8Y0V3_9FLAO|nr:translesion error-prone DNA polymerase V autoproteolytic subunit [Flavobacterium agri]NUY80382.1 translesion error-prone DNA polymerase V autoproteolytic subunit [Flavobacterium agri]NYA70407.1 translesion error-prone DNA polymerase V autoproteolytic subunit [Flavobacterium agri]